jgi:hypothetical protein
MNTAITIVMVQKIKRNGARCAKSEQVFQDLENRDLLNQIDHIAIADERDMDSSGYQLAVHHEVDAAPFFIVTLDTGSTIVYRSYQRFLKEVLHQIPDEANEVAEIMAQNPDLDFI